MKPAKQTDAGSGKKGDVNGDGKVTIADITTLVNMVLGEKNSSPAKARSIEEK